MGLAGINLLWESSQIVVGFEKFRNVADLLWDSLGTMNLKCRRFVVGFVADQFEMSQICCGSRRRLTWNLKCRR